MEEASVYWLNRKYWNRSKSGLPPGWSLLKPASQQQGYYDPPADELILRAQAKMVAQTEVTQKQVHAYFSHEYPKDHKSRSLLFA
jgi:hypothetical protein